MTDVWQQQVSLARPSRRWGATSVVAGCGLAADHAAAGAGVVVQGAFLLVHDALHTVQLGGAS